MVINNELFFKALAFVGTVEGGYVNHPLDRGGATNKGITQATYDKWNRAHCLAQKDVKYISENEAQLIYYQYYWCEAGCNNYSPKFAVLCFDTAVNHGVGRVKQFLEASEYKYPDKFLEARRSFYKRIVEKNPNQKVFLKGWMNRVDKLEKFIETFT